MSSLKLHKLLFFNFYQSIKNGYKSDWILNMLNFNIFYLRLNYVLIKNRKNEFWRGKNLKIWKKNLSFH